uniref:Putative ovule protein n=1 Tax=Solanum chacoense TaxID=4108 RepID=A0A0V0GX64_SOLCH
MRIAANTSSIAKHTRSTSCGVNWKSTLPSVYKLPNEKQIKYLHWINLPLAALDEDVGPRDTNSN